MKKATSRHILKAWLVHAYTALGVPLAMLATIAVAAGDIYKAAVWIAIAMFIDGTDGNFARRWNVKKFTPRFDGRKLDDITDFLTYTFVPVFFLYQEGIPGGIWQYALLLVLVASAYGFSNDAAKTNDGFFTGFPSYWNAVAIYLYWLQLSDWQAGIILLLLAGLTFAPIKFMSFNQTPYLRTLDRSLFALLCGIVLPALSHRPPQVFPTEVAASDCRFLLSKTVQATQPQHQIHSMDAHHCAIGKQFRQYP